MRREKANGTDSEAVLGSVGLTKPRLSSQRRIAESDQNS